MTTAAQVDANRRNAKHSTGPRSEEGKARSSQNATKHGFTGRLLVGLNYGPFKNNSEELHDFINDVITELSPQTAQERAEALNIVGLYVRRSRLVELEALALAETTKVKVLPPAEPGGPERMLETDLMKAGANALDAKLFDRLPRYEAHLGRELDRSLARYARMQEARLLKDSSVLGQVVSPLVRLPTHAPVHREGHPGPTGRGSTARVVPCAARTAQA